VGIVALLATLAGAVILGALFWESGFITRQGIVIEQPVQFSHQHHSGQLGIHCQYCHTSVEQSYFAGFPQTHTCMSCHSQIWTNSPLLEPLRHQPAHRLEQGA
jgi:hypothetical protein